MDFSLTILGSSSALPTSERTVTAHVLKVHERFFLVDCGEGTQIQLRKNRIRFAKIHHIFISHLHGDHFYGLFGLISSLNLMGRKVPLNVYGPPGLKKFLDLHFSKDAVQLDYDLIFHELNMTVKTIIVDTKHLVVESFPVDHKIENVGFIFREKQGERKIKKDIVRDFNIRIKDIISIKNGNDYTDEDGKLHRNEDITIPPKEGRVFAYSSDTRYCEAIVPWIRDADLLYHEATYLSDMKERAVKTGHSTAAEAAEIARLAQVKKLIIGHFSSRYKKLDPLLEEARSIFPETYLAEDGLVFEV